MLSLSFFMKLWDATLNQLYNVSTNLCCSVSGLAPKWVKLPPHGTN